MLKPTYELPDLPPPVDLETVPVLKLLSTANRALAELKGCALSIPNQNILIDTLVLQEARASSEIENIVTTQDELFQADLFPDSQGSAAAREVARYRDAIKLGFRQMQEYSRIVTNNSLIEMYRLLKGRDDGFRTTHGTVIKRVATNEILYVPPQDADEIVARMTELERFVNEDGICLLDPLIKMAVIHHQFESIHPFSDGNGRIGRILNVLYLARAGLLDNPILYLSRHITRTKDDYYRLLQVIRDTDGSPEAWEEWVCYLLKAVATTSETTLSLVKGIRDSMSRMKHRLRDELPALYSRDLLNNLFRHPYTLIRYVERDLGVTRQTAAKYLAVLADRDFVKKRRAGKYVYFVNTDLVNLFLDVPE